MSAAGHMHMSTADCWRILEREHAGRLAVSDRNGEPDILAVTFLVHDGAIDIGTRDETATAGLAWGRGTALEVDGHDDAGWWSVVVRGHTRPVAHLDEVEVRHAFVSIGAAAGRRLMVELLPEAVIGRRFADDEGERGDDPRPVSSPVVLPGGSGRPRWSRPTPIPSRRPS